MISISTSLSGFDDMKSFTRLYGLLEALRSRALNVIHIVRNVQRLVMVDAFGFLKSRNS